MKDRLIGTLYLLILIGWFIFGLWVAQELTVVQAFDPIIAAVIGGVGFYCGMVLTIQIDNAIREL